MFINNSQMLVQTQKLLMTMEMKLSLNVLQMNNQELEEFINDQLQNNVMLEKSEVKYKEESIEKINEQYINNNYMDDFLHNFNSRSLTNNCSINNIDISTSKISLQQHLLVQLHVTKLNKVDMKIGEVLINNLDKNGFLVLSPNEISNKYNISLDKILEIKEMIKKFDPSGVCVNDIKESLITQLKHKGIDDKIVNLLIEGELEYIASNSIPYLSKKLKLPIKDIKQKINIIKSLEPRPGLKYFSEKYIKYIFPDVIVEKNGYKKFDIIINDKNISSIRINEDYKMLINKIDEKDNKMLTKDLNQANYIIRSIDQRKNTLSKIVHSIVTNQIEFFENGTSYIKPMNMKDVADEIDMHESTISRGIRNKYLQCSWGTFELKYFFTSKLRCIDGDNVSTTIIKSRIHEIIENENKAKPLSDSKIELMLKEEGIKISRRTIAKYRDELSIPNTVLRKEF
jgi:RNA polymerase sigma-54 factor